jgi:hypothetical protein
MSDVVVRLFRGGAKAHPSVVHAKLQCTTNSPNWEKVDQVWEKIYAAAGRFYFVVDIRAMGLAFTLANVIPIYTLLTKFRQKSDSQVIATVLVCNESMQRPMIDVVTRVYVPTRPLHTAPTDAEAFLKTGCAGGLPEIL